MFTTEKNAVFMPTAVQILVSHRKKYNGNKQIIIMHLIDVAMISQNGTPTIDSPFLKFDLSLEPSLFPLHGILQVLNCCLL